MLKNSVFSWLSKIVANYYMELKIKHDTNLWFYKSLLPMKKKGTSFISMSIYDGDFLARNKVKGVKNDYLIGCGSVNSSQTSISLFDNETINNLNIENNDQLNYIYKELMTQLYFVYFVFLNTKTDENYFDFHFVDFKNTFNDKNFYNNYNVYDEDSSISPEQMEQAYTLSDGEGDILRPIVNLSTSILIRKEHEPIAIKQMTISHPQKSDMTTTLSFYKTDKIYYHVKTHKKDYLCYFDKPYYINYTELNIESDFKECDTLSELLSVITTTQLDINYPAWRESGKFPNQHDKSIYDMIQL